MQFRKWLSHPSVCLYISSFWCRSQSQHKAEVEFNLCTMWRRGTCLLELPKLAILFLLLHVLCYGLCDKTDDPDTFCRAADCDAGYRNLQAAYELIIGTTFSNNLGVRYKLYGDRVTSLIRSSMLIQWCQQSQSRRTTVSVRTNSRSHLAPCTKSLVVGPCCLTIFSTRPTWRCQAFLRLPQLVKLISLGACLQV